MHSIVLGDELRSPANAPCWRKLVLIQIQGTFLYLLKVWNSTSANSRRAAFPGLFALARFSPPHHITRLYALHNYPPTST